LVEVRISLAILCLVLAAPAAAAAEAHPSLMVVRAGDRALSTIAEDEGADGPPIALSWAPDARAILFGRFTCDSCGEIRFLRLVPRVRGIGVLVGRGLAPDLSLDGESVVFVGVDGGLYTRRLGRAGVRTVIAGSPSRGGLNQPRLSPDARRIVFIRAQQNGRWSVDTIASDGTGEKRLTGAGVSALNPAWSPNGKRIAFAGQQPDGRWQIEIMNADGTGLHTLPGSHGSDSYPTWAPDGKRIAFVRQHGSRHSLYVVDLDGRHERKLTPDSIDAVQPAWSPRDDRIAFVANVAPGD
jgi:Tol biopolymer transport system component